MEQSNFHNLIKEYSDKSSEQFILTFKNRIDLINKRNYIVDPRGKYNIDSI